VGRSAATFGPYPARVDTVHDGDTVYLDIDLGFAHLISARDFDDRPRLACRVFGINAPELSTDEGQRARFFAESLLKPGDRCLVTSHGWDKYGGRFDGTITLADGRDFAATMLAEGHAVPFKG
jgi:endonuclease YncB( thermonuclease family)